MHMGLYLRELAYQVPLAVIAGLLVMLMDAEIRISAYQLSRLIVAAICMHMLFKNAIQHFFTAQGASMPCQHAERTGGDYQRQAKNRCYPPSGVPPFT